MYALVAQTREAKCYRQFAPDVPMTGSMAEIQGPDAMRCCILFMPLIQRS